MDRRTEPARVRNGLSRIAATLPRGKTLPPEVWAHRHRVLTWLLFAHAIALPICGLLNGFPWWHSGMEGFPTLVFAYGATMPHRSRRFRMNMVSLGLLTSSAMLVHIFGGVIEAHFHFFVMVAFLAWYEEWVPYLLAVGFVVLHHGVMSAIDGASVYDHKDAVANPWKWAGIHGGFILAMCVANMVSWRMNEDVRVEMADSEERFRSAFDNAPIGM